MNLEDIVSGIEDITEPQCMERVLMYLDEKRIEDEEFMELLTQKLQNRMEITWNQPWYQQSKCLTRALVHDYNDDSVEKFRTDTVCKEEADHIDRNWQKFRKKFDLPDTLICFGRWKNKGDSRHPDRSPVEHIRHFVTAYLARGLKRTLHQVYKHIVSYYGAPNKGQYSDLEKKVMEICFHHCPSKAVVYLAVILGREPRGIYKRLQQMYEGKPLERKKIRWTLELASKFLNLLLKFTGKSLNELKNHRIDISVWRQMEEEMNLHYVYLQNFWNKTLHTQLFVKQRISLRRLRRIILKKLRLYPYQIWHDIRWKDFARNFPDAFTFMFLYRVGYNAIKNYPGGYHKVPLDILIESCLKNLKNCRKVKLRTLELSEDGILKSVKYKAKLQFDYKDVLFNSNSSLFYGIS